MADLGTGYIDVLPRTDKFTTQLTQQVGGSFDQVGKSLQTLAPAFLAIGTAAVAGITKGIAATQQWAADTRSLQRITGDTAESASALLGASDLLGISTTTLGTAFGTLSKNVVTGSASLAKYNIDTQDAQGNTLPFDDLLGAVIDKFQTLPAGAQQTAFAYAAFGKAGKDLIPILQKGRAGMAELEAKAKDLGVVMSQDDVDASKALSGAQRELGLAIKGAFISIGQLFIPALTKLVHVATDAVAWFTKLPDPIKEIGIGAALAAGAVGVLTVAFSGLQKTFGPVIEGLTSIGEAFVKSGLFQNIASGVSAATSGLQVVGEAAQQSGEQLSLFGDNTSTALQDVGTAANVATLAVTAKAGEQVSFLEVAFSKIGQLVGTLGESLAGIGSSIVAALTSPVGIIIAIGVAVAALAVIVVKNWNTIKTAIGPGLGEFISSFLTGFRGAITEIASSLSELGKSFSELSTAISEAFAPLAPLLGPIAGMLAKIFGLVLIGPFLALLKGTELGFRALAEVIKFVATTVEFTANLIIKAVNAVIEQINNVIGASNKWLGTNFGLIPTVQELGTASTDTATAIGDQAAATNEATGANLKAADSSGRLKDAIQAARPLLDAMGTSYKDLATGAQAAFDQAQQSGGDTTAALQGFADQQIAAAQQARAAFKDQATAALSFASSMLTTLEQTAQQARDTLAGDTSNLSSSALAALRDQANLTGRDILHTFQDAAAQTKSFGTDLLELSKVGGKAGKDLAASLLESGDVLGAQVIADSPKKLQDQIVGAFGKSESATDTFATKLTNNIVGALNTVARVIKIMANTIATAAGQIPPFKIKADTAPAAAEVSNFIQNIPKDLYITLHGRPAGIGGGATGGVVPPHGFAAGGSTDVVPAMLTPGEFVLRRSAVDRIGLPALRAMNAGGSVPGPQGGKTKMDGALRIYDWRNGLATLDSELSWEDTVRTR